MSLKQTPYDHLPLEELARDPNEPRYRQARHSAAPQSGNLLSPLFETPRRTVAALAAGTILLSVTLDMPRVMGATVSGANYISRLYKGSDPDKPTYQRGTNFNIDRYGNVGQDSNDKIPETTSP
jgi:hypothetical protein